VSAREHARAIWQAALAAGDVSPLVRAHLHVEPGRARVVVLGCGKASGAMARAAEDVLGDRIGEGFVVVKDGYTAPLRRIRLAEAGHPVPDARGLAATARLLELAARAREDDLVLVLVSGGGSALTPAPAPPVTLEEKQHVTRLLLAAGATIGELNAVRKHLSRFKGGLLARAAWPATVVTLALSDVIGDPVDVIASGPTAPDPTTFATAREVLERRGVRDRAPASVRERLDAGIRGAIEETPKPGDRVFDRVRNLVIGNNALITDAAMATAQRLGYRTHFLGREVQGEAREVARELVARARQLEPPACLVAGGETTVTVKGGAGVADARSSPWPPPCRCGPAVPSRCSPQAPTAPTARRTPPGRSWTAGAWSVGAGLESIQRERSRTTTPTGSSGRAATSWSPGRRTRICSTSTSW